MESNRLYILTNSSGSIPQKILEIESLNINTIKNYMIEKNWVVETYTYDNFFDKFDDLKNNIFRSDSPIEFPVNPDQHRA